MSSRPSIDVAVVMRRERVQGDMAKWQTWRWVLDDVTPQEENFGNSPKCLREGDDGALWLFPNFKVELFSDDAEGYLLNVTSPDPCFFVMWRMEERVALSEELVAVPERVSLSYHDAGRWLDAQETIEQVPASPDIVQWVACVAWRGVPCKGLDCGWELSFGKGSAKGAPCFTACLRCDQRLKKLPLSPLLPAWLMRRPLSGPNGRQ